MRSTVPCLRYILRTKYRGISIRMTTETDLKSPLRPERINYSSVRNCGRGTLVVVSVVVHDSTFSVVDQFPPPPKKLFFSGQSSYNMGRAGLGLGLGLEFVSKVVFWAFFEMSLPITLEPHVGYTQFPDFL